MNATIPAPELFDTAEMQVRVRSNMRQLSRISYKRVEALNLAAAIKEFFDDNDIPLAKFRKAKKIKDEKILNHLAVKLVNEIDRELFDDQRERLDALGYDVADMQFEAKRKKTSEAIEGYTQYPKMIELSKAYYQLTGGNQSIVARFKSGENTGVQLLAHWYSRHKICPVWNMRKSQIVRKKYREFLQTYSVGTDVNGVQELLIKSHTPVHMVLTLPHANGLFEGERFYARKLLKYFHEMRRSKFFKDGIFGGEYGLEIKKSATNGLHIHLHSFCFLRKTENEKQDVNIFRKKLAASWEKLTGATFCHFETLYFYKKDENGQWIMQHARKKNDNGSYDYEYESTVEIVQDNTGEWVRKFPKFIRKKHYISSESTIEEYTAGVMECIKYHFKMDDYKELGGGWDVPLIMDILNNSVNLRFYSRYGGFLKIPELNFNAVASQSDPVSEEDLENELLDENIDETEDTDNAIMATSDGVESRLVNPFTMELALENEYTICVVKLERLVFRKDSFSRDYLDKSDDNDFIEVDKTFELKEIIRAVCTNNLHEVSNGNSKNKNAQWN